MRAALTSDTINSRRELIFGRFTTRVSRPRAVGVLVNFCTLSIYVRTRGRERLRVYAGLPAFLLVWFSRCMGGKGILILPELRGVCVCGKDLYKIGVIFG